MKELEMAIAQVADGAGLSEPLARILADGFEEVDTDGRRGASLPTVTSDLLTSRDRRSSMCAGSIPSPPHTCSAVSSVQEAGEHRQTAEQEPFTL